MSDHPLERLSSLQHPDQLHDQHLDLQQLQTCPGLSPEPAEAAQLSSVC